MDDDREAGIIQGVIGQGIVWGIIYLVEGLGSLGASIC